jgi:hypothetical protein
MSTNVHAAAVACFLLCASNAVFADDAVPMQTVEVTAARTRLVAYRHPYHDFAKKVQEASHGRLAFAIQLLPSKPGVRVDHLQLWLQGNSEPVPVQVDDAGLFVVPILDDIAAQDGQFSVNKKAGTLTAKGVLVPTIARNGWTVGAVRDLVADARTAVARLTPWYLKPFGFVAPQRFAVSVCSKEPGAQVVVMQGDAVVATLPTSVQEHDHTGQPVFCQRFTGAEPYEQDSRLVIPDEAEVLIL